MTEIYLFLIKRRAYALLKSRRQLANKSNICNKVEIPQIRNFDQQIPLDWTSSDRYIGRSLSFFSFLFFFLFFIVSSVKIQEQFPRTLASCLTNRSVSRIVYQTPSRRSTDPQWTKRERQWPSRRSGDDGTHRVTPTI